MLPHYYTTDMYELLRDFKLFDMDAKETDVVLLKL